MLAAAIGGALVLNACIAQDNGARSTQKSQPPAVSTSPTQQASRTDPAPGQKILDCGDAVGNDGGSTPGPGKLVKDGVIFNGLGSTLTNLHPASGVLDSVGASDKRYFAKVPANVPPGAGPVTIKVIQPEGVTLAWVPAYLWTDPKREYDLADFETRWLTFESCANPATYLGGVLSVKPAVCVTLELTTAGNPPTRVHSALGPASCEPGS